MKKFLEIIKNKWLIRGTTTLLLVLIVIACYIGLNMLVENVNLEDLDFTEKKLYSLSDETRTKLKDLNDEITIQLINSKDYSYLKEYAEKYSAASDKITVEEIEDVTSRVDLQTKYNIDSTELLIVIKNGDNEKTLSEYDLYTYDYSTYKQIDTTEEAITNAIVSLTIDEKPKIYILTGKTYYPTEQALASVISELETESNEVEYLDILSKGEVPEDCSCLVITTLQQDLSELERDKIIEYIEKGGKMMILTSQNILEVETPNFDQVLAEYGISIEYGIILEQDDSNMIQGAPDFIITQANASFMSDIDMSLKMCLIDAGKIEFADEEKLEELGVEYETILTTGETSFLRTNLSTSSFKRTATDGEEEAIIAGAVVKKTVSEDEVSELIIYSSEISATNTQIPISDQYYTYAVELYNNKDVILNSISHLTERTDTITIRKDDESEIYTVTESEDKIIKIIIFTAPVVIIVIGIIVWAIRRRK